MLLSVLDFRNYFEIWLHSVHSSGTKSKTLWNSTGAR